MATNRNYSFGDYTLDLKRGALLRAGADVRLRPKSYEVLRLLVERHGELVTKEELLSAVWGHAVVTDGAVVQCLIDARRAIGDQSQAIIRTVPRRGYIFDSPVIESAAVAPASKDEIVASGVTANPAPTPAPMAAPTASAGATPTSLRYRLLPLIVAGLVLVATGLWWGVTTREGDAYVSPQPSARQAQHNSIAVLPFVDLSPEHDQEYFSDGISEEILNLLAQSPDLLVIARTSSFSFRDRDADIAEIAARLNVAYVLEGSVRTSGKRLRITAQLVDTKTSAHLWSETYDRELKDTFAVQSEIATRVSEALKVTLTNRGTVPTSPSQEAHENFLRARFFYNRRSPGDVARAKQYYEEALRIDPGYARAWVGLSGVYGVQLSTGEISTELGQAKRFEAAERALALDPNLAEAHVRAAWAYFDAGDQQRMEEHARRAYELDPRDLLVLTHLANSRMFEGRPDEAIDLARRITTLDPLSAISHNMLGSFLMTAGRYDEARQVRLKELELNPGAKPLVEVDLGHILILQHRFAEARAVIEGWPEGDNRNQALAIIEHALGHESAAEAARQRLAAAYGAQAALRLAEVYAQRGEADAAFQWMETTRTRLGPNAWLDSGSEWVWWLRFSPFLTPLHGDPRWEGASTLLPTQKPAG